MRSRAAWIAMSLTLAIPSLSRAADPVPIAVTEITSLGGVEATQLEALGSALVEAIRQQGRYRVLDTAGIRKALQIKGQAIDLSCSDIDCLAMVGNALGVRWVASGSLMRFGGTHVLKLKLVDSKNKTVTATNSSQVKGGQAELLTALPKAISGLLSAASAKLHPGEIGAKKRVAKRTAAEQASVDEFERQLEQVRREGALKQQREKAWALVLAMAEDEQLHLSVRRHALQKFLNRFRKNNPYYREAYARWKNLEPATLDLNTSPAGAFITIDGTPEGNSPLLRDVAAGTYTVAASMEGFTPTQQKVVVTRGQTAGINLLLIPKKRESAYSTWGHVSFWSGASLVAFGAASMGLSIKYANDYDASGASADASRSDSWSNMMWVGLTTGAALLGTGIILWVIEPTGQSQNEYTSAGLGPTRDGTGAVFSLSGRF